MSNPEKFRNPSSALSAAHEVSVAVKGGYKNLGSVLLETQEVASRHGNFTEFSGVPHRPSGAARPLPEKQPTDPGFDKPTPLF